MKKFRKLEKLLLILTAFAALFLFGCPIYECFGIVCPCCGTSRAWLSFLSGNIRQAFRYNFFFWLVPILVLLFITCELMQKNMPRWGKWLLYIGGGAMFFYNILRWMNLVALP